MRVFAKRRWYGKTVEWLFTTEFKNNTLDDVVCVGHAR